MGTILVRTAYDFRSNYNGLDQIWAKLRPILIVKLTYIISNKLEYNKTREIYIGGRNSKRYLIRFSLPASIIISWSNIYSEIIMKTLWYKSLPRRHNLCFMASCKYLQYRSTKLSLETNPAKHPSQKYNAKIYDQWLEVHVNNYKLESPDGQTATKIELKFFRTARFHCTWHKVAYACNEQHLFGHPTR